MLGHWSDITVMNNELIHKWLMTELEEFDIDQSLTEPCECTMNITMYKKALNNTSWNKNVFRAISSFRE